ncbi:MAG TPA: DUF4296 domain-containing protein [Chitinophagales bacterium]|nr:DUF4296 domain-containing protein [Chitinophagales bacterium]
MSFLIRTYKYTLLFFALNILIACNTSEKEIPPSDLLSEEKMGHIIADLLLVQNYLSGTFSPNFSTLELSSDPYINEKYQLTDSQAYHSYQYYLKDSEKFNRILEVAKDTLDQINKKFTPELEE